MRALQTVIEACFDSDWTVKTWSEPATLTRWISVSNKECVVTYWFDQRYIAALGVDVTKFMNEAQLVMSVQKHKNIMHEQDKKHAAELEEARNEIKRLEQVCMVQEEKLNLLKEILKSRARSEDSE